MTTKKESALDSKTTLVDADKVRILNSADSTDSETITVQNFRDQLNEHIINIAENATSAEIVTAFTTAQNSKGARVTVQFADDTYTLSSNITVTGVPNLRILGNSANTGNTDNKAVVITSEYKLIFQDCTNVELRYIKIDTQDSGGYAIELRNTRLNYLDNYMTNNSQNNIGFNLTKGSYLLLQDATLNACGRIADVTNSILENGNNTDFSSTYGDPYCNVTAGLVIDPSGTITDNDFDPGLGYAYTAIGKTNASNTVRGAIYKGLQGSNDEWQMSMDPGDASASTFADYEEGTWTPTLVTTGTQFTSVTYDGITAGRYRKIGRMCFVDGTLKTDGITPGAASGNLQIGGLPFTSATDIASAGTVSQSGQWTTNPYGIEIQTNSTKAYLWKRTTLNGDTTAMAVGDADTGSNKNVLVFSIAYRTVS